MEENIKYYWGQLTAFQTKEQCFLIGIYLSFVSYLTRDWAKEELLRYPKNDIGNLKQLREIFKQVPGYELKRAVNDFEESINWTILQENEKCTILLYHLLDELEIVDLKKLEQVIDIFSDFISGSNGLIVTPKCVNKLIVCLLGECKYHIVGDLCCGLSGMGLAVYKKIAESVKENEIILIGEDARQLYCDISQIRMFCHGILKPQVFCNNVLEREGEKGGYELVLADLPKGNNESISCYDVNGMSGEIPQVPKSIFSEWGYIYKILERVSDTGRAFVIATKGALVRERESILREQLIEMDWLDAVITLPEGMYTGSYLGFELLIFDKGKPQNHKNKTFFADLSKKTEHNQNRWVILEKEIDKITELYLQFKGTNQYAVIKDKEAIRQNGYSWNPYLYLQLEKIQNQWSEAVELGSVAEIMRGAQISKTDEDMLAQFSTHYWLNIRNISNKGILLDEDAKISAKSYDWEAKFGLREDDIVITSKGTELKMCIVPPNFPPAFLSGNLTRIRAERIHPYILYEFLNSEEGRISLESIQTGTTIKVLNNTNLKKLQIPFTSEGWENGQKLKNLYVNYQNKRERLKCEFESDRQKILESLKHSKEKDNE